MNLNYENITFLTLVLTSPFLTFMILALLPSMNTKTVETINELSF